MKPRTALLLAVCAGLALATSGADDVLVVRNAPWMPYSGGPGHKPGVIIELLCLITGETGAAVNYAPMPWEEAIATVHAGGADAVIGATGGEAKDKLLLPTENIGALHNGLFVRHDLAWTYESIQSLDGKRIGAIKGRRYWEQFDRYAADHPTAITWFEGQNALAEAITALRGGSIDVLPEAVSAFLWRAYRMRAGNDFRLAHLEEGEPIHIAFSPNERGRLWAQRFDEGIRLLRADGTLAALLAEYGMSDWKPSAPDAGAPASHAPVVASAATAPTPLR